MTSGPTDAGKSDALLHILRNVYGFSLEEVRTARIAAADRIEALERELQAVTRQRDEAVRVLRELHQALKDRHYGKMPPEVEKPYMEAYKILADGAIAHAERGGGNG